MRKERLDFGRRGGSWDKKYEDALKAAILNVFDNSFPFYLSDEEIFIELDKYFEIPKGSNARGESGITYKIGEIREELFSSKPLSTAKTLLIPEWFSIDEKGSIINLGKSPLDDKELKNKLFKEYEVDDSYHTGSFISLKKINDYTIFSYPRIHYADYALIFERIFSLNSTDFEEKRIITLRRSNKPDSTPENKYLYKFFPNGNSQYLNISLLDDSKTKPKKINNVLRHSAFYLLDFILGFLAANIKGSQTLSDVSIERKSFNTALTELEKIKYIPNQVVVNTIRNKLAKAGRETNSEDVLEFYSHFINISENCDSQKLYLPEYEIYTPRLFELYSYWFLKQGCSSLHYQVKIEKEKKSYLYPDMTDSVNTFFFDAKYKFQYGDKPVYCELKDVNQMFQYVDYKKDYSGVFIYPDPYKTKSAQLNTSEELVAMSKDINNEIHKERADNKMSRFLKKGIPFPIKK